MELTDFLTENFISTFSGTLVSVELIVFVSRNLPFIKKIPTRIYTFLLALAHLIIVKGFQGSIEIKVEFYYLIFLNAIVITVILCGGYDAIMTRFQFIKEEEYNKEQVGETENKTNSKGEVSGETTSKLINQ